MPSDRLEELSIFVAICEAGALAVAARRIGRSPAVVTRVLQQLERRLGARLVERTTRKLAVTRAGRRLQELAAVLLQGYEGALREATGERTGPVGLVRVSAPLAFGREHLAPVVARFLDAHPEVRVDLRLSNRVVDLVEERIDVAVRIGPVGDTRLVARPLGEVARLLVASPAYLRRRGTPRSIAELAHHELVVQGQGDDAVEWRFARGARLMPRGRLRVDDAQVAIDAALQGRGIARPLSYQVRDLLAAGKLVCVLHDVEPARLPVSIVYRDPAFLPMPTRLFVDHAASALPPRLILPRARKRGPRREATRP